MKLFDATKWVVLNTIYRIGEGVSNAVAEASNIARVQRNVLSDRLNAQVTEESEPSTAEELLLNGKADPDLN